MTFSIRSKLLVEAVDVFGWRHSLQAIVLTSTEQVCQSLLYSLLYALIDNNSPLIA